MMSYYIDDDYVSNRFFDGEEIGSEHGTISTSRNTSLKSRATKALDRAMRNTTGALITDDDNGTLEEVCGNLYEKGLDGVKMTLDDEDYWELQDKGYINKPLAIHVPYDYNINENG